MGSRVHKQAVLARTLSGLRRRKGAGVPNILGSHGPVQLPFSTSLPNFRQVSGAGPISEIAALFGLGRKKRRGSGRSRRHVRGGDLGSIVQGLLPFAPLLLGLGAQRHRQPWKMTRMPASLS